MNEGKDVQWWCPLTEVHDAEAQRMQNARNQGREMWWYVCNYPGPEYANLMTDSRLIGTRLLMGAMAKKYRVPGFLYWGVNYWNNNAEFIPANTTQFLSWRPVSLFAPDRMNGDACLILPETAGPVATIQLEAIRDGIEDYECYKLAALAGDTTAVPATVLGDSLKSYTNDPNVVASERIRILGLASTGSDLYLPFEEASGAQAIDRSGKGRDSDLKGTPKRVAGALGGGLAFSPSSLQYVVTPNFTNSTTAITFACWAKSNSVNGKWNNASNYNSWGTLLSKRDAFVLSPEGGGTGVYATLWVGGEKKNTDKVQVSNITAWHHYACTYDGSTIKLYVDGDLKTSVSNPNGARSIAADNGPLYIGKDDADNNRYLDGSIDEVRVFNRALSREEIENLSAR